MKIQLIEDNAGGLFIGPESGPWHDVTNVQSDSMFADDAEALAEGETSDWTTNIYDILPVGNVVAEWENGRVRFVSKIWGHAANEYFADKNGEDN